MTSAASDQPNDRPRPVGPILPIVASVLDVLALIPALGLALAGAFASDPGVDRISAWTKLFILGTSITPELLVLGAIGSWVAWGVSRRHRGPAAMAVRGICYLLPVLGLAVIAIGLLGIQVACNGSFTC